jgi:hypothetical protein
LPEDRSYEVTELPREDLIRLVLMYLGDALVHYGMWFTETAGRIDVKTALESDDQVLPLFITTAVRRLAPHFNIELQGDMPSALASKSREDLLLLIADIAKTWLTGDGLWFQAVERQFGMDPAKQVNDSCWSHFAHMEAFKIRKFLGLSRYGGLNALEKALRLRIYSTINAHSVKFDQDGSLLFTMTECRVQSARRKKDMEEYPCKSAGMTEYTEFTKEIDPRINVECVWCPPDRVPDREFCMWRFRME